MLCALSIQHMTYINVGGVLLIELALAMTLKSKIVGVIGIACPIRSSRTITNVIPDGPMFFCAQAKITPNCRCRKAESVVALACTVSRQMMVSCTHFLNINSSRHHVWRHIHHQRHAVGFWHRVKFDSTNCFIVTVIHVRGFRVKLPLSRIRNAGILILLGHNPINRSVPCRFFGGHRRPASRNKVVRLSRFTDKIHRNGSKQSRSSSLHQQDFIVIRHITGEEENRWESTN